MSGTRLSVYTLQLQNMSGFPISGAMIATAGGAAIVTVAGSPVKATLFNPDTGASLANPVALTRGQLRFATLSTVMSVDVYGFAPDGGFFIARGVRAGADTEINYDPNQVDCTAVVPLAIQDYVANTEGTTGLQFTAGSVILPTPAFRVTTLEAARTIEVGLLSSESGGDLDGFIDALSLAAAGTIVPAVSGTPTLGALLVQNFGTTPAVNVPDSHAITATARTISVTFSASTAAAQGYFILPYIKPAF